MKIIVATDFSRVASNATHAALTLARTFGDALVLVRVVEPMVEVHPELRLPETAVFDRAVREASQAEMARFIAGLPDQGVVVEGRVVVGNPARVLAAQAADEGARLIVMGASGHRPIARLFLGSTAERTLLEAPCPVLVVPEGAAPFDRWQKGEPLRLVVGVELDGTLAGVLGEVTRLRAGGACDVTLVHTYWPPGEYARLGLRGPRDFFSEDPEVVAVLERELRARIDFGPGPGTTTLRIQSAWGRLGDTLAIDAKADGADLVVVGTRQPHGWDRLQRGSAAIGALRAARTAVLCVPARAGQPATAETLAPIPAVRSVLVPTDLSDLGNAAVPAACALLRAGGVLEIVHVREQHLPSPLAYDKPAVPLTVVERTALEARLRALVPAEAAALGITAHVTVIDGGAAPEAILGAARRLGVDALALASHGHSGMRRALLGSVSEAVMRGAQRPVLVIRRAER